MPGLTKTRRLIAKLKQCSVFCVMQRKTGYFSFRLIQMGITEESIEKKTGSKCTEEVENRFKTTVLAFQIRPLFVFDLEQIDQLLERPGMIQSAVYWCYFKASKNMKISHKNKLTADVFHTARSREFFVIVMVFIKAKRMVREVVYEKLVHETRTMTKRKSWTKELEDHGTKTSTKHRISN